jgi:hypothetical protein
MTITIDGAGLNLIEGTDTFKGTVDVLGITHIVYLIGAYEEEGQWITTLDTPAEVESLWTNLTGDEWPIEPFGKNEGYYFLFLVPCPYACGPNP